MRQLRRDEMAVIAEADPVTNSALRGYTPARADHCTPTQADRKNAVDESAVPRKAGHPSMSVQHRHDPARLAASFRRVRALTEALAAPLAPEDQCIQSMPDASPTKWHLAHTSWFFETFVLDRPGFERYRPGWEVLFNSYYQTVGAMHPRPDRGLLSRPTVAEIGDYRRWVDERVLALLERDAVGPERLVLIELGLHHEQQHQELILTDIKHALGQNPLAPRYRETGPAAESAPPPPLRWIEDPGGLGEIGRDLDRPGAEFGFDNGGPRRKQWLEPFAIAGRPASCAEDLAFIDEPGYGRAERWLAVGWGPGAG